ncbi:hypothetical protein AB0M43_00480 [Longispora sp. NPDC051575]|uniref:hypothetical protein n=1 Tax=Longispora sp. NPDC051575 TaxID=3154943 RepID=UPI003420E782
MKDRPATDKTGTPDSTSVEQAASGNDLARPDGREPEDIPRPDDVPSDSSDGDT